MGNLTAQKSGWKSIALILVLFLITKSTQGADFYWVGGSGNWSDFSSHWATSSGGSTFRDTVPLSGDNVYFDSNSFSSTGQTVTINQDAYCNNMSWTGTTNNPTLTASSSWYELEIYGSLTTIAGMTWHEDLTDIEFMASSGSHTITSNGLSFGSSFQFEGDGSWTLADELTLTDEINFADGTFNSANYNINVASIDSWGLYEVINLGTSTITVTPTSSAFTYSATIEFGTWSVLDADEADFVISNPSGYAVILDLSQKTIGNLTFNNSSYSVIFSDSGTCESASFADDMNINFQNDFTFQNLTFSTNDLVSFNSGSTYTVSGTIVANGDCENYITWLSSSSSSAAILSSASAQSLSNVVISGLTANVTTGNITCDECADVRNNTGGSNDWNFTNKRTARKIYYIGNSGNWGDKGNWSINSNGTSSNGHSSGTGECIPNLIDTVVFNSNSFNADNQTITLNKSANMCADISFSDIDQAVTIASTSGNDLLVNGSYTGDDQLTQDIQGDIKFYGEGSDEFIDADDEAFEGSMYFNGGGTYYLEQNLDVDENIYLNSGSLDVYNLANSTIQDINIGGYWENAVGDGGFTERTSTLTFDGGSTGAINQSSDNDETLYRVVLNKQYSFSSVYLWDVNLNITQELLIQNGTLDINEYAGSKTINCNNLCQIIDGAIEIDGDDLTFNVAHDLNADGGTFDLSDGIVNITEDIDVDGAKIDVSGGTMNVNGLTGSENGITVTTGELEVDGGTVNVGNGSTEDIIIEGGSYDQNGGTVNLCAQFTMTSGDYNHSGGTLNIGTSAGSDNLERLVFSGGSYTLSGGTTDIQSSGNGSSNYVIDIQSSSSHSYINDGGHTFKVSATNNNSRVNVNDNRKIANLEIAVSSQDLIIEDHLECDGGITITSGEFNLNGNNVQLSRDWINNSTNSLIKTTESVTFDGSSSNQNIGGSAITSFYDLIINNTRSNGEVDLDIPVFVESDLTLTSGDVESRENTLYLTTTSYPGISGGSASSHINGTVSKVYNSTTAITFPLGDGSNYNPLWIEPTGSDTWVVSYETSTPTDNLSMCEETFAEISSNYYWNVSPAASTTAKLRFYFNNSNWGEEGVWGTSEFMIGHYNSTCAEGSGGWEIAPGNMSNQFIVDNTASGDITGYIQSDKVVTDFSPFTFAKSNTPIVLPVEFLDFTAEKEDFSVELHWSTASEINNDLFEVQRFNKANETFETIGKVDGSGNSSSIIDYSFTDESPNIGENLYRIKQIDFDEQYDFSGIQSVLFENNTEYKVYPNPSNGKSIFVKSSNTENFTLKVYNSTGALVINEHISSSVNQGINFENQLSPGLYELIITDQSTESRHKLIIQ